MIDKQNLQLLELQARLASALGQLRTEVSCTVCGVPITGQYQKPHKAECPLSNYFRGVSEPQEQRGLREKSTIDMSFSAKAKSVMPKVPDASDSPDAQELTARTNRCGRKKPDRKSSELKTGNTFRRADGSFDRKAWAKQTGFGRKPKEAAKALGLPEGLGGLECR